MAFRDTQEEVAVEDDKEEDADEEYPGDSGGDEEGGDAAIGRLRLEIPPDTCPETGTQSFSLHPQRIEHK